MENKEYYSIFTRVELFGLLLFFISITNFLGYLMQKTSIEKKKHEGFYLPWSWVNFGFHTFPENISPKVNEMTLLEFKLISYDITV